MIKKILHLSDLHFGTERPGIVELLMADCKQLNPDMIIVSGDLTQRATPAQFKAAKQFLANFADKAILCVPGNHDISLYNLLERFIYPFSKYKKWISPDLCSHYSDDHVSILGINSVTPYKSMGGYITDKQLMMVEDYFTLRPKDSVKIVVMHHNLISSERHKIINDSDKILEVFANAGVNMVLSGHIHHPYLELIQKPYIKNNLYVITAGTAISTRTSAPNSFNIVELQENVFNVTIRAFDKSGYINQETSFYPLKK